MTLEETSPIFVDHGGVACGVVGGCAGGGARRQDSLLGRQMCSRVLDGGRSRREMSRVANCATTVAASLAIVLLVILLVILWTGVGNFDGIEGAARSGGRSNVSERISLANDFQDGGRSNEEESLTRIIEVKGPERNLTNEVDSREYEQERTSRRYNDTTLDILPPPSKGDLEYVRPMKISQNQYEDPPDEFTTAKRHHSGHFRHATAEVWDPHPQYEFTAFGKRFRLRLAHDSSFVSPDVKVTHMSENSTRREHPGHQLGCFYSGSVDGDPSSAVSVSLCHGMTGHMRTSTGSYFIKPAEQWRENDDESRGSTLQHAIHRVPSPKSRANDAHKEEKDEKTVVGGGRNCGVIDYDTDDAPTPLTDDSSAAEVYVGERRTRRRTRSLTEKTSLDRSSEQDEGGEEEYEQFLGHGEQHRNFLREDIRHANSYYSVERRRGGGYRSDERTKRDSEMESDPFVTRRPRRALFREYFIEIMVVADAKMVEYHGDGLVNYIFVLMSTVSRIYKDKTVGNPISIAVVNIVKTDEIFGTKHAQSDGIGAAEMLKRFCYWQKRNNPEEPSPDHHDAALLLTRENLCHIPGQKCDTLGLAELGRMCSPAASCAIVQDNGLAAAFTIAHEIGHVLNMPHDDDTKCTAFKNRSSLHNVMSRMLDDNTFPWEWSKCSRHFLTEFLEGDYGKCLLDEPVKALPTSEAGTLPGEHYSENKQCELVFGPDSRICPHMVSDVCRRLWCTIDHQKQCHTQHMPWADGTSCGIGKWCHRGECVSITNLEPVDGQWGEWGLYGECSRTCGGGVKRKYRECNNPPPQNGGNYCVGDRVKYRSCGTKECPSDSPNFREQQCSKFDNNNLNIQNLARDVKWHAKYARILPQDRCKLYCQVESNQYYMLREKVIDGTPCGPDTFHICVNGHCKPAGCDHVLNSTAELDTCGVCRGDNSTCQRITGSYNVSIYGYTRVAKIPAGSSNIDIRQHSWLGSYNDSNYLALRLGEGGEYILNGNSNVMHRKVIVLSGVTIEYSGPKAVVERLNSSRPIGTDLILEVLSVESILGNVLPPQITYEYTVPKKILGSYTWVLSDWSNCNRICQGTKYRRAECRSTVHKDVVLDDYCRSDEKPREESQMCNVHCNLQWQVTSVSECSSHCGPGTRSVISRCYYTLPNSDFRLSRLISDHACSHLERPGDYEVCMGPCGDTHWRYGEWGPCSTTCGGGIQFRNANCVDSNERNVPDDSCDNQEKHLKRICTQESCPKWRLGEWSPCSVTCGVGKRERQYWCHVENRMLPNSYCGSLPLGVIETCDVGPCQKWHAGDWSPCSVTCGEGISRRKVVCKNMDGTTSEQCPSSEKPEDAVSCLFKSCPAVVKLPPISYSPNSPHDDPSQQDNEIDNNRITFRSGYKWHAGPYGACTKSCNTGEKSRTVKCISTETGVPESNDYCDKNRRPHSKIICNSHPCPIWNTGDWTQCNAECGSSGYQHRQVRCQSPRGEDLPDEECLAADRPKHAKKCQKPPCTPTGNNHSGNKNHGDFNIERRWKMSIWSACSKSCGGGVKTRRVECTVKRGSHGSEQHLRDEQCLRHGMAKPRSQRPCQRVPCDFTWQQGPWSECSAECGEGVRRRTVTCHRVNHYGWVDPTPISHGCLLQKPPEVSSCIDRRCGDEFSWMPGPWEKCNKPCGRRGRQTRHLSCRDSSGKRVTHSYCPADLKPQRKRKCLNNERKCGPKTCLEAQKRFNTRREDGEYVLIIGGRSMLVYCHGMRTAEPREYLTLPAGETENFAEIYDKRLMNPDTCPFKGQRNDSCHCVTERGTISGKTKFGRVRLDPRQLKIIANDYTFSQTDGNNRVEFGKAGDCYSQRRCPQGRFSIDLTGTRLRLSSSVSWTSQSQTTSLDINRITDQRVVGRCGGYCGFCIPSPGLKLDVLPP